MPTSTLFTVRLLNVVWVRAPKSVARVSEDEQTGGVVTDAAA
jgi:hypothetical protein